MLAGLLKPDGIAEGYRRVFAILGCVMMTEMAGVDDDDDDDDDDEQ